MKASEYLKQEKLKKLSKRAKRAKSQKQSNIDAALVALQIMAVQQANKPKSN